MKVLFRVVYIVFLIVVVSVCYAISEPLSLMDQNIQMIRSSFSAFNNSDWGSLSDHYSPHYLHHSPESANVVDFGEYERNCRIVRREIPALQFRIVCIFANSDMVAVRYIWEYRNNSYQFKLYYPGGLAQGSANSIFRIKNGKIVEEWCEYDPKVIRQFCTIYKRLNPSK